MANLLTDIIRDVAQDMNLSLSEEQIIKEQDSLMQSLTAHLAWHKHQEIMKGGMPWLEKSAASNG